MPKKQKQKRKKKTHTQPCLLVNKSMLFQGSWVLRRSHIYKWEPRSIRPCLSFNASSNLISSLKLFLTVLPRTGLSHLQGSETVIV